MRLPWRFCVLTAFVWLFFAASLPARAASPPLLVLNSDSTYLHLTPYVEAFNERGDVATLDDIRGQVFSPPHDLFADAHNTYWLRFRYQMRNTQQRFFLFFGYKPAYVDLYVERPGGELVHERTGAKLPFAQRPERDFGVLELRLPAAALPTTAYLRIKSIEPSTALSVEEAATMRTADASITAVAIALCSILFMLFLMSVVLVIMLRRSVYAYYALYLLSQLLYKLNDAGITGGLLWPNSSFSWMQGDVFFDGLTVITATLFMRSFLGLPRYSRLLDRLNLAVGAFAAVYALAAFFDAPLRVTFVWNFAFVYIPVWIITTAYCWRRGHGEAKFLLVGWSALMIGQLLLDLKNLGLAPSSFFLGFFFSYGPYVGLMFECMFITMILSFNTQREYAKRLEKQVAQRTQQLNDALSRMANANKELESFSYAVSHDLRAPLRAISGFSEALADDYGESLGSTGTRYIERITGSVRRMTAMIEALLGLATISRFELNYKLVDVSTLVRELVDELLVTYPGREVEIIIEDGVTVVADRRLLGNLLQNLLANALKFTSRQATSRIEFGSTIQDGETVYFVQDDGPGFDPSQASKLFAPFQRLHAVEEFPGTGIGLATTQRIVHRHGGRIWADATPGGGARFSFTLGVHEPLPAADSPALPAA